MLKLKENIKKYIFRILAHPENPINCRINNLERKINEQEVSLKAYMDNLSEQYREYSRINGIVDRFLTHYSLKQSNVCNDNHFISYYYDTYGKLTNLGDYIQTIATEEAIKKCVDTDCNFVPVQRNKLVQHDGGTCVMQGWYEHDDLGFLPGPSTRGIWIGTHLNETTCEALALLFKTSSIRLSDVGCRDLSTLAFCKQYGISSYFSRCLTLTLPKRTIEEAENANRTYLVECSDEIVALLPDWVKTNAERISHRGYAKEVWQPWQLCKEAARDLLDNYKKNAKIVVTTALHCAQPCIAMGIPVVFICPGLNERERFSSMKGLIQINSLEDLKAGVVDFSPKSLNIEDLKSALLMNLKLTMKQMRTKEEETELINVRDFIHKYSLIANNYEN